MKQIEGVFTISFRFPIDRWCAKQHRLIY